MTGIKVKETVGQLKPSKLDMSNWFTSDALINGQQIMFDLLASIFRSCLTHSIVSKSLLACVFLPLLNTAMKDPSETASYRTVAGFCLVLKLLNY